ncbi:hypothetical protein BDN72DRAFT_907525 [Pluteus cervinus]|uniref:Uncharacterized protein n=1 Tax=Pluteus cervinus TaxID=181527 RepID=A0ACD2ZWL1_9AGAR|nr:hypothetical protein BDN72DRAFT_907525 [Pluteus cervinus]
MVPSTPQELARDPNLLLHKRGQGTTLNPWDGLVGAVVDGGDFFVTTPNMPIIYMPPLRRRTRSIRIRSDFRYAQDDPVLWPQLYTADYCHLGAIPQQPEHKEDPLNLLWTNLTAEDFHMLRSTTHSPTVFVTTGQVVLRLTRAS